MLVLDSAGNGSGCPHSLEVGAPALGAGGRGSISYHVTPKILKLGLKMLKLGGLCFPPWRLALMS